MLTEGQDYADTVNSYHIVDGAVRADTFKFSASNDSISATEKTLTGATLIDLTTTDNDVLTLNLGAYAKGTVTGPEKTVNIEEFDIVSAGAEGITFTAPTQMTGVKTVKISGSFVNATGTGVSFTASADNALATVDASGVNSGSVILDTTSANQALTIIGPNADATIKAGSGDDIITGQGSIVAGSGNDTITVTGKAEVTGGAGADTITTGATGVTTFKYTAAGETAQLDTTANIAAADAPLAIRGATNYDTLTVKAGDKITTASALNLKKYATTNFVDEKTLAAANDLNKDNGTGDVFVLKTLEGDYFLVYEASGSGTTDSIGSGAEVIKLVGFTDTSTITVDTDNKTIIIG